MAEHTLELVKVADNQTGWHKGKEIPLPAWDVVLDGTVIGRVRKAMITREHRTPGRRYVNKRWTSPGWRYQRTGSQFGRGLECPTRSDGIERLVRDTGDLTWTEAEALAASVKGVR